METNVDCLKVMMRKKKELAALQLKRDRVKKLMREEKGVADRIRMEFKKQSIAVKPDAGTVPNRDY